MSVRVSATVRVSLVVWRHRHFLFRKISKWHGLSANWDSAKRDSAKWGIIGVIFPLGVQERFVFLVPASYTTVILTAVRPHDYNKSCATGVYGCTSVYMWSGLPREHLARPAGSFAAPRHRRYSSMVRDFQGFWAAATFEARSDRCCKPAWLDGVWRTFGARYQLPPPEATLHSDKHDVHSLLYRASAVYGV